MTQASGSVRTRLFFGVCDAWLVMTFNFKVKVLGRVNSNHNHNPKHIYNPNPNPNNDPKLTVILHLFHAAVYLVKIHLF